MCRFKIYIDSYGSYLVYEEVIADFQKKYSHNEKKGIIQLFYQMSIPVLNYYSCTRSNYMNEVDDNGNEIHGEYDNSKVKIIFLDKEIKLYLKKK